MTAHDFSRYRAWHVHDPDLDISLDASRMGLDEAWLTSMDAPLAAAWDAMEALEGGAIANPDEGRQVGHYWLRAPELAPARKQTTAIEDALAAVKGFADRVHSGDVRSEGGEPFCRVVSIGIGGSALGPQFVSQALRSAAPPLTVDFLDNTDPDGFARAFAAIGDDVARTLFISISKSGTTPETRNGTLAARRFVEARGMSFAACAVAVTGVGSALDQLAQSEDWLARFPMWDWVGGRTSEMSAVGLLPAALEGLDVAGMLAGAAAMDRWTRTRDRRNPAALLALCWHKATDGRGARDMVILPYKDRLALLARYLQQLVMESLGKEKDLAGKVVHQGIAVYGNKGSTDQHAFVQQLREGVPNFFTTFIEVLCDTDGDDPEVEDGVTAGDYLSGFLLGTREALHEAGRPSLTVTLPRVSATSIGALVALYERAVGLYATLVGINAYHQPGVEAGKKAAANLLELQRRLLSALRAGDGPATCIEVARRAAIDDVESVFLILRHLAANRRAITVAGDRADPFGCTYSWSDDVIE